MCRITLRVKYAVNKETNEAVAIKVLDKVGKKSRQMIVSCMLLNSSQISFKMRRIVIFFVFDLFAHSVGYLCLFRSSGNASQERHEHSNQKRSCAHENNPTSPHYCDQGCVRNHHQDLHRAGAGGGW